MIRFEVADNGIGMDHETQKNLFSSPFSTKGERGTGLGLLVTEKIVKENGGVITVESKLGKGTSFTFLLPYREAQKKATIGG
jgi:signal transduction histidine kinase